MPTSSAPTCLPYSRSLFPQTASFWSITRMENGPSPASSTSSTRVCCAWAFTTGDGFFSWDNLNPGGWLEVRDIPFPWGSADGTAIADSPLLDWSEKVRRGALKAGIDTTACKSFEGHLRAIRFVNLRKEMTSFPLGAWPRGEKEKRLGAYALENLQSGLSAISTAVFSRYLDMSTEAIEVTLMEARKDLYDPRSHFVAPL